jgi:hypothetical protein
MTWEDHDDLERGGACNECGDPVEREHHAYCPSCYREQQGWSGPRPPAGQPPESFVVALYQVRRQLAELERRVVDVEAALDALTERRSRAA